MTNRHGLLGLGLVALLAGFASAQIGTDKKVSICHHPPGNAGNTQTISVSSSAVPAHLSHGDSLGECPSGCQNDSSLCDDGNQCTSDACLSSGLCQHTSVDCNDGNPCTTDLCDGATGCLTFPNDGAACDDGSACTSNDVCKHGACAGTGISGCCTTDAECDDGAACTQDTCVANICRYSLRNCSVADFCHAGFCDPATGQCDTTPVSCDDSNVCTDDLCDPSVGCLHPPTTNPPQGHETLCSDGVDNDCDGFADENDSDCHRCNPGFADCDAIFQNGCETNLNSVDNCGGCGNVCVASNSSPACTDGECEFFCNAGFADCDGSHATGCETHLDADTANCGGCGVVCSSNHVPAPACSGGICSGACAPGFADCDGDRQGDGCETNIQNDPNNCGACGQVCPVGTTCSDSTCG